MSILVGVILSVLVLILWLGNHRNIQQTQNNKVEEAAQLISFQFEKEVQDDINTLLNLKSRLEVTDGAYFDYWEFDAGNIVGKDSSIMFIEWIDSTMVIRKVEPLESNKAAIGLDISKLDYRRADWLQARKDSVVNFTHWLELVQGPNAFLVDAPVYYNGIFQGTITAGMNFTTEFNSVMKGLGQYHIEIFDDRNTLFYQFGDSKKQKVLRKLGVQKVIELNDTNTEPWTLRIYPTEADNSSMNLFLNLALGLALCLVLSVVLYLMQTAFIAQKSSNQANSKIRALIDSSPMAIYTLDTNGIIRDFWNKAAEDMLGWTQEEAVGHFLPHVTKGLQDEHERLMKRSIKEGGIKNKEIIRYKKDGSPIHLRLNVSRIIDSGLNNKQMLAIAEDITREIEYKEQLEASVHEKEVLLSEVHHRVKNNLAIIVGLIELQKEGLEDEKLQMVLKETQNRIYSISGVHELLYNTDSFTEITFEEYAVKLIERIRGMFNSTDRQVSIEHDFSSRNLNINQAIPLGLLLNELITNSFKHAFEGRSEGRIFISLREEEGNLKVVYKDDGKGFDKKVFEYSTTLGVTLIKTLIGQLEADYELESEDGFTFTFKFEIKGRGAHSNL